MIALHCIPKVCIAGMYSTRVARAPHNSFESPDLRIQRPGGAGPSKSTARTCAFGPEPNSSTVGAICVISSPQWSPHPPKFASNEVP